MIPINVNNKEELLKYLIPLGFFLRRDDDDDFYIYKNEKYKIALRFHRPNYEIHLYDLYVDDMYDSDDYYGYPECIEYLNRKFKSEFRRNKLKKILGND